VDTQLSHEYYVQKKLSFLKSFDRVALRVGEVLSRTYEPTRVRQILRKTHRAFEALLPRVPYIGGRANPFTGNLLQAAWCLAFYKTMKSQGESVETVGQIIHEAIELQLHTYPRLLLYPCILTKINRQTINALKKQAADSEQMYTPQGWRFEVVDGDGQTFDVGINYHECGLCKFYHAQRADELTRYMCEINTPVSKAFNIELSQTERIPNGNPECKIRLARKKCNRHAATNRPVQG
jgi:hypothetical protein